MSYWTLVPLTLSNLRTGLPVMTVLRTDLGRKPVTVWGQRSQRAPKGLPRAPPSRAQRAVLSGAASLPALIAAVSL